MILIVYIGRFQPLHWGHLKHIRIELKELSVENDVRLLMLLGCNTEGRTLKNPFTYEERKEMIINSLSREELHKITIEPIMDRPTDNLWQYDVIQIVNKYLVDRYKDRVYMIGNPDEKSSYYLDIFPDFMYTNTEIEDNGIHATHIREAYFKEVLWKMKDNTINHASLDVESVKDMVPSGTYDFLKNHVVDKDLIQLVIKNGAK